MSVLSERIAELMVRVPWPVDVVEVEKDVRAIIEDYATVEEMKSITREALIASIVGGINVMKQGYEENQL